MNSEFYIFEGNGCEICQAQAGTYPTPRKGHPNCNCTCSLHTITEECRYVEQYEEEHVEGVYYRNSRPHPTDPDCWYRAPITMKSVLYAMLWECCKYDNGQRTDDCWTYWDYAEGYVEEEGPEELYCIG